ncbi:MAG: hypothetical protein HDT39_15615 [Lachnospiraceae bacterium]|nr:hypothetical protein [Lachnospiraceae bacterium]
MQGIDLLDSSKLFEFLFEITDYFVVVFDDEEFTLSEKEEADEEYKKNIMNGNECEEFKRILLDKFYCGAEGEDNYNEEYQLAVKSYNDSLSKRLVNEQKLNRHIESINRYYSILNRNVTNKTFFSESWYSYVCFLLKIDDKLKKELRKKESINFVSLSGFEKYINEYYFLKGDRIVFAVSVNEDKYLDLTDDEKKHIMEKY